jgi:transposase
MSEISTIGLDLAKSVFQVHAIDGQERVVVRRSLKRKEVLKFFAKLTPCLVGMEACATAHHWARELMRLGHRVKLIPPAYVKPYVKRGKNDAADAAAICEAVGRPSMSFVAIKTKEQQSILALHRARDLMVGQRTRSTNQLRGLVAEFGLVAAKGLGNVRSLMDKVRAADDETLPEVVRQLAETAEAQIMALSSAIKTIEKKIDELSQSNEDSARLRTIPGFGPMIVSALPATVPDPERFASGRGMSAFLGIVPGQRSTGGKTKLGPVSKQGNGYLRRLLYLGAMALVRTAAKRTDRLGEWIRELRQRRPARVVAMALANKLARIAWAVLTYKTTYQPRPAIAA